MVIGSCQGPTATFENFKPIPHFRRLLGYGFSIPKDWNKRVTSNSGRFSRADPSRNDTYVSPENAEVRHMSRLHQSDGLSILARYTSVAAIALASSTLPLKSAANEQARDDQVKVESSEDGQTETGGRSAID